MSEKHARHFFKLAVSTLAGAAFWLWTARWDLSFPESRPPAEKAGLEVRIKDHREAIADFARLEVAVDAIRIRSSAGLSRQIGWMALKPSRERVDITKYLGTRSASVFKGGVPYGSFDTIDLKLKGIAGVLKKNDRAVPVKNLVAPIRLLFTVDKRNETLIILDLTVLDISDHPPRGYELHLRGYELYKNEKLVERVPPA